MTLTQRHPISPLYPAGRVGVRLPRMFNSNRPKSGFTRPRGYESNINTLNGSVNDQLSLDDYTRNKAFTVHSYARNIDYIC